MYDNLMGENLFRPLVVRTYRPTHRQRLRAKWRDFRWRLGHLIVGHDCDDD